MAEAVELPEARDGFEKAVALTIAVLAVILSFIDNKGDNAKTDAIVKTNEAANQWAFFQSKSLKENFAANNSLLLEMLAPAPGLAPDAMKTKLEALKHEAERYDGEKKEIKAKAEALKAEADAAMEIDDRCDLASLLLQIGVVVASISILVRWKAIFFAGAACGLAGAVVGITAFFL